MAWAEKLPSGKYRGVYRDAGGKRRSAGTFSHKAKAEREAGAKEQRVRRSSWSDPDAAKRPWGEWCDEWWPTRSVEPGTLARDGSRRRVHLDPRWAKIPIGSISRHDVRGWAAQMRRQGVGASTAQRAVHLLSASLSAAVDAEVLVANPAARLKLGVGAQAQERFLTRDEFTAVLEQMPTTDDQLVMYLLAYTGLRWGEMAGLHWNRLDLDNLTISVAETWDENKSRMKAYPKGRRVRFVPIDRWLADLLDERPRQATCGQQHAAGKCRSGLVMTTEGGSVLRNSNWSPVWRDAVDRAGIGHARPHDLRHTYASWLIQSRRVSLADVGQLMGHRSPATTQKYAHLDATNRDDVMAALAEPGVVAPRKGTLRVVKDAG